MSRRRPFACGGGAFLLLAGAIAIGITAAAAGMLAEADRNGPSQGVHLETHVDARDSTGAQNDTTTEAAWIRMEGTSIDYPLAQASEENGPDFYLTHDLSGAPADEGCPYIDHRTSYLDRHVLVYGHNSGGTTPVFADIRRAWEQETFDTLGTVTLTAKDGSQSAFVPFFALKVKSSCEAIQRFSFPDDDALRSWLSSLAAKASAVAQDIAARGVAKRALTLVTCSSLVPGGADRTLVVCVETDYEASEG